MPHDLPPLAAIRVFEAAARHLSFTRAADELGMTQAAVSYQIKVLEERVGQALFTRRVRQVALTEVGAALAPGTTAAFELLSSAFGRARASASGTLSISVQPTFASNWLAQRIGDFQMRHPDLAVRLRSTLDVLDFEREEIDLSIRWGRGGWPGLTEHVLLETAFAPMSSPAFLNSIGGLDEPADILRHRLIDPSDPWWDIWLRQAGVPRPPLDAARTAKFGAQYLEGRAALAGHGIGILSPVFFVDELASGRLVQPFPLVCGDGTCYFLCYPTVRRNNPKIRAFRDWIMHQTSLAERASPAP